MHPAESIFYTLWRGIAIGILISAPMGPVGILCIQRTLDKGRRTGFFTGIGASISDLFYCLLTGFGLSFIEEFLEQNQNIIQLAGSAVLIAFSIYLFKKNPAGTLRSPSQPRGSDKKNILGGFLFTFSNPLILFLIIGLFARFNFLSPDIHWSAYVVGYISIFVGALMWWWIVTFFIDKVRNHFNLRSMWLINRIIGSIILLFALVGITTGIINLTSQDAAAAINSNHKSIFLNRARGYMAIADSNDSITTDGITITAPTASSQQRLISVPKPDFPDDSIIGIEVKFKAKDQCRLDKSSTFTDSLGHTHKIKNTGWIAKATNADSELSLKVTPASDNNILSERATMKVALFIDNDSICETVIPSGVDPNGINAFLLRFGGNSIELFAGNRKFTPVLKHKKRFIPESVGFQINAGGKASFSDIAVTSQFEKRHHHSETEIENKEIWTLFDLSLDNDLMRIGGNYRLVAEEDSNGCVSFYYLDGADIASHLWQSGKLKIRLYPTGVNGVYNVEWYDVSGNRLHHGIRAQKESPSTLKIMFPYHNSQLRLQRLD